MDLKGKTIAIIGYGNQARAQALNMRDSGLNVIVGLNNEEHKKRAQKDKFPIHKISEAVKKAQFIFLLISDEVIKDIFEKEISSNLKDNDTIVFASGYTLAFNSLIPHNKVDILLISPRVPGIGVREGYLNKRGFFNFVCVHQDF